MSEFETINGQVIELWLSGEDKWWWALQVVPENDKVWCGPYEKKAEAVGHAQRWLQRKA